MVCILILLLYRIRWKNITTVSQLWGCFAFQSKKNVQCLVKIYLLDNPTLNFDPANRGRLKYLFSKVI